MRKIEKKKGGRAIRYRVWEKKKNEMGESVCVYGRLFLSQKEREDSER